MSGLHQGRCAREPRSDGTHRRFCKSLASLRLWRSRGGGRDARVLVAVAGSDPPIRHASYGTATIGMCTAIQPSPGVAPVQQSRAGRRRATAEGARGRFRDHCRGLQPGVLRFTHHCVRRAVGRRYGSPRWIGLAEKRGTRRDFDGRGERPRTPLRTVSTPLAPGGGRETRFPGKERPQ